MRKNNVFYSWSSMVFVALLIAGAAWAEPLETWHERKSGIQGTLYDVTFGSGLFVAAGGGGTIITSSDGIVWTERESGSALARFNGVAYGNGRFIAVGPGVVHYSTDGIAWTKGETTGGPSHTEESLHMGVEDVIYCKDRFIVLGGYGYIYTSPTGTGDWTNIQTGATGSYQDGVCTSDLIVAVTDGGRVAASSNGVDWTVKQVGTLYTKLSGVAYGNNTFVAVGYNVVYTSPNGTAWRSEKPVVVNDAGNFFAPSKVVFVNGTFVAAGRQGYGYIYTSPDGIHWMVRRSSSTYAYEDLNGIVVGGCTVLAAGGNGSTIMIVQSDSMSAASLSSAFSLSAPVISVGDDLYSADFAFVPPSGDFVLIGAQSIKDTDSFSTCSPSSLSADLTLHIPVLIFDGLSYWADLRYVQGLTFTVKGGGAN